MATVRALWEAVDAADDSQQFKIKRDISETINRLKSRVETLVGNRLVSARNERSLFEQAEHQGATEVETGVPRSTSRFTEPVLRVYAKDLAEHSLQHLPHAAKYRTVPEFREYLAKKLPFNSEATRRRCAEYIVNRFFPGDVYNGDLPEFAAAAAGKPSLGDALFYVTCRAEKILSLTAEEIVFPLLPQGGVRRTRLHEYIQTRLPDSKSVDEIGSAIVRTYETYGVGHADRTRLSVSLREGSLASFGYVLHLEFPEPGMYSFDRILGGPMHKWLLWDRQWMVRQLYRLREAARNVIRDFLTAHPGSTKDRIYDALISNLVQKGQMEAHDFDALLRSVAEEVQQPVKKNPFENSHVQSRWYLKESADQLERAEQAKEDAGAARLANFIREYLKKRPEHEGVHYSDLLEQYLGVQDKPRRLLVYWLPEYFIKTPSGTWRLPDKEEAQQLAKLREAGTLRRIKRFANTLIEGVPVREQDRPGSDVDLLDWLRQCRRAGLYDQGKAIYEKGGMNFANLTDEQQIEAEDDYRICVRRGSSEEAKPKPRRQKVQAGEE
ncbi:MAG: hypothetical protein AUI54_03260 [Acidobacteria bacterium 13_1_40CM_2_56_5]|nr:MAG: hypothetical protein AUI54_03260 [Acidobacteria bacterium 13_1_40CM_2_56_5]